MKSASLDVTIAQRIADHEDSDVTSLDPPLHEVVDVDALEALISSGPADATGTVSFDYREYTVTVDYTGSVSVTGATASVDSTESADVTDRQVVCNAQ